MSRPSKHLSSRGAKFKLSLLKIEERDEFGRPTKCRVTYDEEKLEDVMTSIEKENREVHFLLVYIDEFEVKPKIQGIA